MSKGKKEPHDYGCTHEELVKFLHDYAVWYAQFTAANTEDSNPPGGPPPPPPPGSGG